MRSGEPEGRPNRSLAVSRGAGNIDRLGCVADRADRAGHAAWIAVSRHRYPFVEGGRRVESRRICSMTTDLIISYDGTPNDDDALGLGKLLAQTGFSVALAYVRHSREFDPRREQVAQHDAEQRLERGAALMGGPVARHIVVGAATGEVLGELAQQEGASIVVFGSDYRTPLGRAEPGTSAQRLLDGGPVAIAVAAAGLRAKPDSAIRSIAGALRRSDQRRRAGDGRGLGGKARRDRGGCARRLDRSDCDRLNRWRASWTCRRGRRGSHRTQQRSQLRSGAPGRDPHRVLSETLARSV